MDVAGFYPNVPHGEVLVSLRKFFGTRDNKQFYSDTLAELTFKQKRGSTIYC